MAKTITNDSFGGRTELASRSPLTRFKEALADKMQAAAAAVEQNAAGSGGHRYRWQAAELLDRSANYVRSLDADHLKDDLEGEIRASPGRSLAIAAASGLVIGMLLGRR